MSFPFARVGPSPEANRQNQLLLQWDSELREIMQTMVDCRRSLDRHRLDRRQCDKLSKLMAVIDAQVLALGRSMEDSVTSGDDAVWSSVEQVDQRIHYLATLCNDLARLFGAHPASLGHPA